MKCGVGDYTCRLAEELASRGNEVHIITSNKADIKCGKLLIHNIVDSWEFSDLSKILRKVKEINPNVVNVQYPSDEYKSAFMMSILPLRIKMKIKCKVTATIHEYDYDSYSIQRKLRLYLNFAKLDKIITAEEEFINKIKYIVPKADIEYIPISSNISRSNITEQKKEELLKKYDLEDKKVISYFGFARPLKGIEQLIEVIDKLEDNIRLLFIGELDEKNEYQRNLINLIDKLNIKEKIIITGFFDDEKDVADLLQISNVCVLPFEEGVKTRNGSFLAAYNQKIKVITTSKSKKDDNGIYYVEPKNQEQLLQKIKKVLETNEEINREILTWGNVAERYIKNF